MNYAIEINELDALSIQSQQLQDEPDQEFADRLEAAKGKSVFSLTIVDVSFPVQPANGSPRAQVRRMMSPYFESTSDLLREKILHETMTQAGKIIIEREGKKTIILTLD